MKKTETVEITVAPNRSRRSDQIPDFGVGILPDTRGSDSLTRCLMVVDALFYAPDAPFPKVNKEMIQEHLAENALLKIIMIYWHDRDYDHRTKNSDLKRELGKVVTHLRSLNKALGKVSRRTGDTINYLVYEQELRQTPKTDVFMKAVHTNALLLKYCEPLISGKHEKTKRISAVNLAAAMIAIWERVAGENFKANTKKSKIINSHPLIKDLHEFQGRGPHFVHVMLQTIDPTITQSMVESSIKALTDRSRRKMAQKIKP